MRWLCVTLVAAGFFLVASACSARMERALELTWDDITNAQRESGRADVILIGPIL
jgi:hypothetical protein